MAVSVFVRQWCHLSTVFLSAFALVRVNDGLPSVCLIIYPQRNYISVSLLASHTMKYNTALRQCCCILQLNCIVLKGFLGAWYSVPGTWNRYLVLGTWYSVRGTRYSVISTRYLVLGNLNLVLGNWYLVFGTRYLVPGTQYVVPGTW